MRKLATVIAVVAGLMLSGGVANAATTKVVNFSLAPGQSQSGAVTCPTRVTTQNSTSNGIWLATTRIGNTTVNYVASNPSTTTKTGKLTVNCA